VTVLFADFVGFTSLAEDLDPEELQMLVSGIFEDLAEEALRYDGTIEKFIGDAIFVIFGAPIAHEDDPQRALRCAIGMQKLFAEHSARVKAQLGIELGLRDGKIAFPRGVIQGQKLQLLLRRLLLSTLQTKKFDDLPIPFRSIASELARGDGTQPKCCPSSRDNPPRT